LTNQTNPTRICWYHDSDHQLSLSTQALILSLTNLHSKKKIAVYERGQLKEKSIAILVEVKVVKLIYPFDKGIEH